VVLPFVPVAAFVFVFVVLPAIVQYLQKRIYDPFANYSMSSSVVESVF
jgi:hypothetical protein